MKLIYRFIIPINQMICHWATGQSDITISAYSYTLSAEKRLHWPMRLVDSLFFWQNGHCQTAFVREYADHERFMQRYKQLSESLKNETVK